MKTKTKKCQLFYYGHSCYFNTIFFFPGHDMPQGSELKPWDATLGFLILIQRNVFLRISKIPFLFVDHSEQQDLLYLPGI